MAGTDTHGTRSITGTFARGAVATPNHFATAAGRDVLAAGGNAVDAAVAAGLVLAVVTPYHCGLGGDVLAMVWDGQAHGMLSVGAAPAGAGPEQVRAALDAALAAGRPAIPSLPGTGGMPDRGALSVTVPGAVAGWLALLDRHGSWSPARVAEHALRFAEDGVIVSAFAARSVTAARARLGEEPGWEDAFGGMREGERFVQPELARTLRAVVEEGADAFYGGPLAEEIAAVLAAHGSAMTVEDLAAHRVEWVEPIVGRYRGMDVLELPPPTQGVSVLTALAVLEALGPLPTDPVAAGHLQVEAVRAAMADRQEHVGDPATMRTTPEALLAPERIAAIAGAVDRDRAGAWPPARPATGGTAYLCAADSDGLLVSLIQSNFKGFGSGVVVPTGGFGLHNRGSHLSLDPTDANAIGPRRRPLHTLIPALVLEEGEPRYVMGTMGGDAQAQVHVQLLGHLLDRGTDVATAVAAPRFVIDVGDGSVALEPDAEPILSDGLVARGHTVTTLRDPGLAGHAHVIALGPDGYEVASDPRCDGAAAGI
jgi:gamma-glutamyltranspeptidase / glutathione hydrolase